MGSDFFLTNPANTTRVSQNLSSFGNLTANNGKKTCTNSIYQNGSETTETEGEDLSGFKATIPSFTNKDPKLPNKLFLRS